MKNAASSVPDGTIVPDASGIGAEADRDADEDGAARLRHLGYTLVQTLDRVRALGSCLETLDDLLVTGRPSAIADAAMTAQLTLEGSQPLFADLGKSLSDLGLPRLHDAAERLRSIDAIAAAAAAESLAFVLKRFAKRNAAHHRRAESLHRGLEASLQTLHALGLAGSGRLLAEA